MSKAIRYKDCLAMPNSELHTILTSSDPDRAKKAASHHTKVTDDAYKRGEFIRPVKLQNSGISGRYTTVEEMRARGASEKDIATTLAYRADLDKKHLGPSDAADDTSFSLPG